MNTFRRIIRYVRPYPRTLFLATGCMVLFIIFNILSIAFIMPLVDIVFNPPQVTSFSSGDFSILNVGKFISYHLAFLVQRYDRIEILLFLAVGILVSFLLKNLFWYLNGHFMTAVEQNIIHDLRVDLYTHLQNLSMSYFTEERKGHMISSIINDARIINDSAMAVVNSALRDPPQILLYTALLFFFDWQLSLVIFLLLPLSGIIISRIADRLKKSSILSQEKMADLVSVLDETLANVRIVKAFGMEDFEIAKFTRESHAFSEINKKIQRRRNWATPISEIFGVVIVAFILWFLGKGVIAGNSTMTPGGLLLYIGIIVQMMQPLKLFGQVFNSIQEGIGAGERVFALLDTPPKITTKQNAKPLERFSNAIRYENVTFKYETGNEVLNNISCEIKAGETVAIVGPSGSGKSTMVDLLSRFYDPTDGKILIDGNDLRDVTVESIRKLMGMVTQETILFNDTVRNNIAYGKEKITLDEVMQAAKVANAHSFIAELPQGYNTIIGDRGVKLSGGERQRLSIARAILKNPSILIFDEATSALDTQSELLVQEAIERLLIGRTSIVIAHRLSTIQRADKIFVLDNGKLVEAGKHEELLQNPKGVYKRLYELQFSI